jgi:hypothetical protein
MFKIDKNNLLSLPDLDFEVCTIRSRTYDLMGNVTINGKYHYYISPECKNKKIVAKSTYNKISFYDECNRILHECERLYQGDGIRIINWGEYFRLLSFKPGALNNCDIIYQFPEQLRDFLVDNDRQVRQNYMRMMHAVYLEYDFAVAVTVAEKAALECLTDLRT